MLVSYATINERAAFMSFNAMVLRIGQTVGPLLIGICYSMGNLRTSFFGGAAIAVKHTSKFITIGIHDVAFHFLHKQPEFTFPNKFSGIFIACMQLQGRQCWLNG